MTDDEWRQRLDAMLTARQQRRDRDAAHRQALTDRRDWGLTRRHARKLRRAEEKRS
ncbi:MAG TPA: hypothetical protein VGJ44_22370 [Kribbellaceae bacterium]